MAADKNKIRLRHILDSIRKIEIVLNELSYEDYIEDWKSQDILIRNLEVIGEAARHVDDALTAQYPEVAWRDARGMRNFLIHAYFQVDPDEIWKTVTTDIPLLKLQITKIFEDL